MSNSFLVEGLFKLSKEGDDVINEFTINNWSNQTASFLNAALGTEHASEFLRLKSEDPWQQHAMRLGHIQGLIAKISSQAAISKNNEEPLISQKLPANTPAVPIGKKIFVVHGHDGEAKEVVARFLEKLGLQPIILHEQPNSGRTIIEKFETYSGDTAFAVVLLTPDDVGASKDQKNELKARARQNVILELGYFLGKLSRVRVCALYKGGVDLPSDIQGILYVAMDQAGAWKTQLAQEFVEAKLPIDIGGLVSG